MKLKSVSGEMAKKAVRDILEILYMKDGEFVENAEWTDDTLERIAEIIHGICVSDSKTLTPANGDIKINDDIRVCGTCFQGYIDITYDELVEKLGASGETDGYKTDAEWALEFPDGTVATIYNYKTGKNYCGAEGLDVEDITDWHIGGKSEKAVELVHQLFEKETA